MTILYEYRSDVRRYGMPNLRTKEEMEGLQGFTSIYGFDEEVAQLVKERRGTWGLDGLNLYSDTLYIDIDSDMPLAEEVKAKLIDIGLSFEIYASGSPDSCHFHVPLVTMYAPDIQYIQKQWVEDNLGRKVDLSIYKTSGIIRLIGSFHKKHPGKWKKLIDRNEGNLLDLTDYEAKVEIKLPTSHYISEDEDKEGILDSLLMTSTYEKIGTGRHNTIFKIAALASDIGWDKDKTTNVLLAYNSRMVVPAVRQKDIFTTVNSAYRRR